MSNKLPAMKRSSNDAPADTRRTTGARAQSKGNDDDAATGRGALSLGLLPDLLGYQLRVTQRAVFDDFADAIGEMEVSPGLFGMLIVIEANPGLRQSALAHAARLDRSSLVPALDKLEARRLVTRRASEEDRRVNGLWLTTQGSALLKKLKQRVLRHEERLARHLSAAEHAQLLELLAKVFPERR